MTEKCLIEKGRRPANRSGTSSGHGNDPYSLTHVRESLESFMNLSAGEDSGTGKEALRSCGGLRKIKLNWTHRPGFFPRLLRFSEVHGIGVPVKTG